MVGTMRCIRRIGGAFSTSGQRRCETIRTSMRNIDYADTMGFIETSPSAEYPSSPRTVASPSGWAAAWTSLRANGHTRSKLRVQNQPLLEQKAAPQDHADAGPMGHVERPQGESAYNDLQFTWQRWSRRRIARELGIDRETVGRYLLLAKPAISTTGDEGTGEAKTPTLYDGYLQLRTGQCSRPERTFTLLWLRTFRRTHRGDYSPDDRRLLEFRRQFPMECS
jgi:hypothetical protein